MVGEPCLVEQTEVVRIIGAAFVCQYRIDGLENLLLLKELQYCLGGLGEITTYHVLTEVGLPVLKTVIQDREFLKPQSILLDTLTPSLCSMDKCAP
jgi:hypothetical protein